MEEILHYLQIMGYAWINYQPQLVIAGFLNHQQVFHDHYTWQGDEHGGSLYCHGVW